MSNQQKSNREEEVDLGSLFIIIEKVFSKLFNLIWISLKSLFHYLITSLIFVKRKFIIIAIFTIIGSLVGLFLELISPERYGSQMLIEPNFKSARQIYNSIRFYDDLVKQKDTARLQSIFKLSKEDAASLRGFEITPIPLENDIISAYDELIVAIDTSTIKSYNYNEFKNSFTSYDYRYHEISVEAEKNDVFQKLGTVIIESVVTNPYYNRIKEITNSNLNRTDSLFKSNLKQLDSLRMVYTSVMIEEARKTSSGTNIDLGGGKERTKELELFETNRKINEDLRELAEEKSRMYEVVNVVSDFQEIGSKVKGVTKNYISLLGIIGFVLALGLLILIEINKYLNNYSER